jgi:fatty acid desaturase
MLPDPALLAEFEPTDRVVATGRPTPAFRDELRRIPTTRNAFAVLALYAQTIGIIVAAVWLNHPVVWVIAFLLMGRAHAQFAALMHEAAHRLLFRNRRVNDWVARWLLGFPSLTPVDLYRRGHMAHHRDEFGPDEPDIPLYRGYPIAKDSFRRKLSRDATGRTGWKLFKGLLRGVTSTDAAIRSQARAIVFVQLGLIAVGVALGHPWVYFVLWLAPYLTVWRVINRLRSIAEHGGMQRSKDRRLTTHSVRQSALARFMIVPFHIGWHLAHHVDAGVPMANLPRLHEELRRAGYVTDALEYPSYRALWRKLASGRPAIVSAATASD